MAVKSLREQLTKIALKEVKMSDGKTLGRTMADEAKRLYACIQYYIDEYYKSYQPKVYDRTNNYRHSLRAEKVADIRIEGNTLRIRVKFDYILAMHPNLEYVYWGDRDGNEMRLPIKDRHDTFVPLIMETGWYAPKLANMIGGHVYRLTYFEGIGAVEKGIADFNKTNKLGIKVDADDFYKGRAY